jgi:RHS repeat-associated protein
MPNLTSSYNVENQLTQAVHTTNGTELYGYNPFGQRVWKKWATGGEEVFLYGPDGRLLVRLGVWDTYNQSPALFLAASKPHIYFAGIRVSSEDLAGVHDRLGTKMESIPLWQGVLPYPVYPYGELRPGNRMTEYATYPRDYTGLDYAMHRYYSSQIARFTTPDPYMASGGPANPQSWNRYAYVMGDPVNLSDTDGLMPKCVTGATAEPFDDSGCMMWILWLNKSINEPGTPAGDRLDHGAPDRQGGRNTSPLVAAATGWQYLTSIWSDCLGLFSQDARFSTSKLKGLLTNTSSQGGITWWDTRYSTVANQTVGSVTNTGNRTMLKDFVGDASAKVIPGTSNVVLGLTWHTEETQTQQVATSIHEALHVLFNQSDSWLKGWLMNFGFKPAGVGTGDISDWIATDCGKKKP